MIIRDIFEKSIDRPLEGVIKVGKDTEEAVYEEVSEYVVTKELKGYFSTFFEKYADALKSKTNDVGVWISGFFGSGKSHFLKILSYILGNKTIRGKRAYQYFEDKINDAMIVANMKAASDYNSDVILFNIDSVSDADAKTNKEGLVKVFNKVFNRMQGFSESMPWLAEIERQMVKNGTYENFKNEFKKICGDEWKNRRDDFYFEEDNIVEALSKTNNITLEAARNTYQKAESNFSLSIDQFVIKVREYIESKGRNHNVIFMIDEMGQYIGNDSGLMLNLQTIVERLGVECGGRAWVFVTSQEAIDTVSKNINNKDFSKIQGRFSIRISLSSSNVDEVIKKRILAKNEFATDSLKEMYAQKGAVIKNLISFSSYTPYIKIFKSDKDFIEIYPFLPYQFNLLQSAYNSIRNRGASGKHLSEGERSLLSAFKESAMKNENKELGALIPFGEFYNSIETFLDHEIRNVMTRAENNENLVMPDDLNLLKTLFLVKDLDDKMPANLENLTTLSLSGIDDDKLALRKKIEESIKRLYSQNLIQRDGDKYIFLTNDEQDVNREIDSMNLAPSEIIGFIGDQIFNSIVDFRYKYNNNVNLFSFNQIVDDNPRGQQVNELGLCVYTPYYGTVSDEEIKIKTQVNHIVVIRMPDNPLLVDEIEGYLKLEKYIRTRNSRASSSNIQKILSLKADELRRKQERAYNLILEGIEKSDIFANASKLEIKQKSAKERINEAFKILVESTYTKLNYITKYYEKASDLQSLLSSKRQMSIDGIVPNQLAIQEMKKYVERQYERRMPINLRSLYERFQKIPYGWNEIDIAAIVINLLLNDDIKLELVGNPITVNDDKLVDYLTKRDYKDRIAVKLKIKTSDEIVENIKRIYKNVFTQSVGYTNDEELRQMIKRTCENELYHIQSLLGLYPQSGYYRTYDYQLTYLNDIPYHNSNKYPGYDLVNKSFELFKKLSSITDASTLFEKFIDSENELMEYKSNIDVIKNFFEHQRDIFEKGCNRIDIYKQNKTYFEGYNVEDIISEIDSIISLESPYKEIYRLPDLCQKFDNTLIKILEKESEPICKEIDDMLKEVIDVYNKYEITAEGLDIQFKMLKDKASQSQIVATIHNVREEAIRLRDSLINQARERYEEKYEEECKKNPNKKIEKKIFKKTVSLSIGEILEKSIVKVETEEDIDKLANDLKTKLKEKVKDNVIINIK